MQTSKEKTTIEMMDDDAKIFMKLNMFLKMFPLAWTFGSSFHCLETQAYRQWPSSVKTN